MAKPIRAVVVAVALGLTGAAGAMAQGLFSPAITVNDDAITYYELEQRELFLRLLRAPGNPAELARSGLIEDRLKQQAVEQVGIEVTPEDIELGMEELASRANLSREEFVQALAAGGVSFETFRDFTEIGLSWREYARARFLGRSRPSDDEIDRALGRGNSGGGIRVLLSEIIIPFTPQTLEQVEAEAERISQVTSTSAFSAEAERFSATETRTRGGRMDWMTLTELPPQLRPIILALTPGDVTAPIPLPNAVALFQLRDIQEASVPDPSYAAIEYAAYYMAGGRSAETLSAAAEIAARIDTCDDLYGIAKGQPPEVLDRESLPPGEIPNDIALELSKLDANEVSTALTRSNGQTLVFLMLCGRTAELGEDATREDVAGALTQQRLNALADSYLEQLRADAIIIEQ